ncbi:MAG: hypothetical protein RIR10_862 [Planctomycetota bacterium]
MELAPAEVDVADVVDVVDVDDVADVAEVAAPEEACATAKPAAERKIVATMDIGRNIGPLPRET